ncbi:uncharacterized protein LOC107861251 [Capsicum annuum]|uniref:uncharacterized protein LOC107861251 n=1 Tax=Capsicum annuum TaxID=4072 RepID=UPI0007BF89BF|nr:uncharacterized protein LOC107861251 [Capsicum annuum]
MNNRRISKHPFDLYCWFFQVVAVLCLTSIVIWLCLVPKNPIFTIVDFSFLFFNIKNSSLHSDNNSVILNLEIFNPNKVVLAEIQKLAEIIPLCPKLVISTKRKGLWSVYGNIRRVSFLW